MAALRASADDPALDRLATRTVADIRTRQPWPLSVDARQYYSYQNELHYSYQNELPEISGAMDTAAFMGNLLFVQTIFVQTFEAPMGRCGALRTSFGIMSCLRSLPLRSYPIPSWGD